MLHRREGYSSDYSRSNRASAWGAGEWRSLPSLHLQLAGSNLNLPLAMPTLIFLDPLPKRQLRRPRRLSFIDWVLVICAGILAIWACCYIFGYSLLDLGGQAWSTIEKDREAFFQPVQLSK